MTNLIQTMEILFLIPISDYDLYCWFPPVGYMLLFSAVTDLLRDLQGFTNTTLGN